MRKVVGKAKAKAKVKAKALWCTQRYELYLLGPAPHATLKKTGVAGSHVDTVTTPRLGRRWTGTDKSSCRLTVMMEKDAKERAKWQPKAALKEVGKVKAKL